MYTHPLIKSCAALALFTCAQLSLAAPYDYTITKLDNQIQLDDQRHVDQTIDMVIKLNTIRGVQQSGQIPVPYIKGMNEVEVHAAQTIKADGRIIDVDKDKGVFDQPLPVTMQAPMYSQMYVKSVVFPALEVGDSIRLRYSLHEKESMFPGSFSFTTVFPQELQYGDARISLRAPANLKLNLEQVDIEPAKLVDSGGWKQYEWRYTSPWTEKPEEIRETSILDTGPRLVVSTFSNWAEFAAQYQSRAADKATVTPAIQELADKITQGVNDRREQARLLYNWVNLNLRYVAIYFGAGPVVPHEAPVILANLYGDCKDHVTLLAALLRAKGIKSSPALINAGEAYRMPNVALSNTLFNHIITHLPEFDLFVDATNKYAAFGELPFSLGDKPTLLTQTGEVKKTPPHSSSNTFAHFRADVAFDGKGNATVNASKEMAGYESAKYRIAVATQSTGEREKSLLEASKMNGKLSVEDDPASPLKSPYTVRWKGSLEHLTNVKGKFLNIPRLPRANDMTVYARNVQARQQRQLDAICPGKTVELDYRLTFPKSMRVQTLPPDVNVHSGGVSYLASYHREGNTVIVRRVLDRPLASHVCTPAQLRSWMPVAEAILKDHQSAILFK
ncbi:DUF3857 and transglutaminase domain-containing protein [Herbaspirillum sp. LeCh32-8]|uniref:DUF3857 domain-containing transglutaminase family protein n=1 Tax=Herbaspirillum sp. LeCh32-8 TaxID=2821356 RepID=UPI001AEB002D|nr:DUF3857 and transglutaminase domain-containing protein [Herbaspirillum sp. LeCh32-8]MBP0597884.1 DUF3857 and transglutaminase domain-containing protein [Herbaspirillum sp. LeCh32-8]